MTTKKEIAPKGMTFNTADFIISDKFATILTVLSYPKYITPGYLSSLTSGMAGVKIVIKHIPVAFEVVSKMLNIKRNQMQHIKSVLDKIMNL